MLWSLPERAHEPIVAGRKRTLAAARISEASSSVIQSAAAGTVRGQSFDGPDDVGADPDGVDPEAAVDGSDAVPPEPVPSDEAFESDERSFEAFVRAAELRSFFAQPEPLNTIAGGAKPLRSVPSAPHSGQNVGMGSLIPWRMSVRRPHAEHP